MDITQTYTNMAKAIKWQIPFASLSGTLYRLDIYAEGYSGDPIQLTAGESPFVTEEDSSEDSSLLSAPRPAAFRFAPASPTAPCSRWTRFCLQTISTIPSVF